MSNTKRELLDYLDSIKIINTHSHYNVSSDFTNVDLEYILSNSYAEWLHINWGTTKESRKYFIKNAAGNTYVYWLFKALKEIYNMPENLNENNWHEYDEAIKSKNTDMSHANDILKNLCSYEKVILDNYNNPGAADGYDKVFVPAYRIDMFLKGYNTQTTNHNGITLSEFFANVPRDIDEYVSFVKDAIVSKKQSGCAALKCAIAYERGLDFERTDKQKAQKVFSENKSRIGKEDIKHFQDYVFYKICEIAAENNLTMQCHTGLGAIKNSNGINLMNVIEDNPDTRFALLHLSYPWIEDVFALCHKYSNVYPDLTWVPLISTSACERFIDEYLDIGTLDRLCWGCDTFTAEESYGALLAMKEAVANAAADKINRGFLSLDDGKLFINNLLYNNPKRLYFNLQS